MKAQQSRIQRQYTVAMNKMQSLQAENEKLKAAIQVARKTMVIICKEINIALDVHTPNPNRNMHIVDEKAYEQIFALAQTVGEEPSLEETNR